MTISIRLLLLNVYNFILLYFMGQIQIKQWDFNSITKSKFKSLLFINLLFMNSHFSKLSFQHFIIHLYSIFKYLQIHVLDQENYKTPIIKAERNPLIQFSNLKFFHLFDLKLKITKSHLIFNLTYLPKPTPIIKSDRFFLLKSSFL